MTTKDVARAAKRGPYAKSEERRQTILDAAHAVFAARGYRGGSLQDVADRAGMSQTSLLHYFPSKRDLLMSVLERRDEITSGAFPDDMEEGLADSVIRTALYNEDIPGVIELYTVLCAESVTDEHPGRDYFTERYERLRASYGRMVRGTRSCWQAPPGRGSGPSCDLLGGSLGRTPNPMAPCPGPGGRGQGPSRLPGTGDPPGTQLGVSRPVGAAAWAGQPRNAPMPVMCWPRIRVWTSSVPSYVLTDSRLLACRRGE